MGAAVLFLLVLLAPGEEGEFFRLEKAYKDAVAEGRWKEVAAVAGAIGRLPGGKMRDFLQAELRTAKEEDHRRGLFRALALRRDKESLEFLETHLEDEDPYFRSACLEGLETVAPDAALRHARTLLEADPDPRVRRQCAGILVRGGRARDAQSLVRASACLSAGEQRAFVRLASRMDAEAIAGLAFLLDEKDLATRLLAVRVIAARADERLRPALERARRDKHRGVSLVALAGLDRLSGKKHSSALRKLAEEAEGFTRRCEILEAISRTDIEDPALGRYLISLASRGDRRLRGLAAEAAGHAGRVDAVAPLAALLTVEKPWQVPIGAARGLAATRVPEAVPYLIRGLERAEGRLKHEISKGLASLTGQPFGHATKSWKLWWRREGSTFRVPDLPPSLWKNQAAARDRQYAFYGIELHSEAVAFVCDISGSMQGSPLARLKKELGIVLKRFPPDGRFNLIFFESNVHAWSPHLLKAGRKTKARALRYAQDRKSMGATDLWGGLTTAMKDRSVDTIVLLSDGQPTSGVLTDLKQIRKEFLDRNRTRMVELHVVSLGYASPELRDMARLSGGTFNRK